MNSETVEDALPRARGSRLSQGFLNPRSVRVRAAEHAPRGPFRVLAFNAWTPKLLYSASSRKSFACFAKQET